MSEETTEPNSNHFAVPSAGFEEVYCYLFNHLGCYYSFRSLGWFAFFYDGLAAKAKPNWMSLDEPYIDASNQGFKEAFMDS